MDPRKALIKRTKRTASSRAEAHVGSLSLVSWNPAVTTPSPARWYKTKYVLER
jgi:hypothetical protein